MTVAKCTGLNRDFGCGDGLINGKECSPGLPHVRCFYMKTHSQTPIPLTAVSSPHSTLTLPIPADKECQVPSD